MKTHTLKAVIVVVFIVMTSFSVIKADPLLQSADEVNIQLSWIHEYSTSAFHTAYENGYFDDENLDVTFAEGGFSENGYIDPIQEVVSGNYDFGLASGVQLIAAAIEDKPVVAVAALLQRSPQAIISLGESNIRSPRDLTGHRVALNTGASEAAFYALLDLSNIDRDEVEVVPRTSFGIDPVVNGEVDAFSGWIINEGVMLAEAGEESNFILFSDYAVDTYEILIFTTQDKIDNNPELVERFLRATLKGAQDVIDDPEQATENTLMFGDALGYDEQLRRLEATIPLMNVPGFHLGAMEMEVWEATQQILLDSGLVEQPIDLEIVFDTTFIDTIFSQ